MECKVHFGPLISRTSKLLKVQRGAAKTILWLKASALRNCIGRSLPCCVGRIECSAHTYESRCRISALICSMCPWHVPRTDFVIEEVSHVMSHPTSFFIFLFLLSCFPCFSPLSSSSLLFLFYFVFHFLKNLIFGKLLSFEPHNTPWESLQILLEETDFGVTISTVSLT